MTFFLVEHSGKDWQGRVLNKRGIELFRQKKKTKPEIYSFSLFWILIWRPLNFIENLLSLKATRIVISYPEPL